MIPILLEPAVTVTARGPVSASLVAPSSKSLTNRAILVAGLATGTSELHRTLESFDASAMLAATEGLGAGVRGQGDPLIIDGVGGRVRAVRSEIDARLSGTTMRFGVAAAALCGDPITFTGEQSLLARPMAPLSAALRSLGATVIDDGGYPPVTVRGPLVGGAVTVDVSSSSQFLSALLIAAPYAEQDVTLTASGMAANAYIDMTAEFMARWGADIESLAPGTWHIRAGGGYIARNESIEFDASAAAHLYALAAASGGQVTVTNVAPATLQPDAGVLEVLEAMGCTVERVDESVTVTGPERLTGVDVDLATMPDQLPTLAVLGAIAEGTTRISGAAVTRGHETDRIAAMARELGKLGVTVTEEPDGLIVQGGRAFGPARLETYNDHRLAMAFAALSLRVEGVTIEDPGCVAKTYPDFWDDLESAGAIVRSAA